MTIKIWLFISLALILTSCGKTEVTSVVPSEIPSETTETVVPKVPSGVMAEPFRENTPRDVHGADVTGKAQDVPVGTSDGIDHTSEPTSASSDGSPAPSPSSN